MLDNQPIFTITDKAKIQLLKLIEQEEINPLNAYLRVSVKGGGCSGLSYELDIDELSDIEGDDISSFNNGINIVIDNKSLLYLLGTELDFSDGLNGKGFVFNNPQSKRECGCGSSFSV